MEKGLIVPISQDIVRIKVRISETETSLQNVKEMAVMQRTDSLEKTLMLRKAGGEGDDRGQDGWMASLIQWT